jgi:hypothetical protein
MMIIKIKLLKTFCNDCSCGRFLDFSYRLKILLYLLA